MSVFYRKTAAKEWVGGNVHKHCFFSHSFMCRSFFFSRTICGKLRNCCVVEDKNKALRGITNFLVAGPGMTLSFFAFFLHPSPCISSLTSFSLSRSLPLSLLPLSPSCTQRSNGVSTFRQLKKTKKCSASQLFSAARLLLGGLSWVTSQRFGSDLKKCRLINHKSPS